MKYNENSTLSDINGTSQKFTYVVVSEEAAAACEGRERGGARVWDSPWGQLRLILSLILFQTRVYGYLTYNLSQTREIK